jgi:SAM-dependent methyltransferase
MQRELDLVRRAIDLQSRLDSDEYVQQFIVRNDGPPTTYRGRQTQQKLDEINRKCRIDFDGKSFIDLGCNKGFFPLYAAKRGAYRAVGIDPDATRIERANDIAAFTRSGAEFLRGKFDVKMVGTYGVFDVVYVGSAYHYFWLDYRDHDLVFDTLAQLTGDVLIFEGCTSLDDEQWRLAAIKTTGEPEAKLRAEFNEDVILRSARRHFDIETLGRSGHASHRYLFTMKKKGATSGTATMNELRSRPAIQIAGKNEENRAGDGAEAVSVIEMSGARYIKKLLSKNRLWCEPAIKAFERSFRFPDAYPKALCRHYGSEEADNMLVLFQAYQEASEPLAKLPHPIDVAIRQALLHGVLSMQRDLLTAGLVHIDIHETNILMTEHGPCVIDFEGLALVASDEYKKRFSQFYTLNFLAFIEKALFNTKVTRNSIRDLPGMELYGAKTSNRLIQSVLEHLKCSDPEVRLMYREVLENPALLTNVNFYEVLLRTLPSRINTPTSERTSVARLEPALT